MEAPDWLQDHAVLFVDDEADNLLVLKKSFSKRFRVLTARDGEEALRWLAAEPVAMLVTDQRMPGMSGVELCAVVRERWPDVRRVILTAWGDREVTRAAINAGGAHAFIDKPWQVEQLERLLHEAVADAALRRQEERLRGALIERERLLAMNALWRRVGHDLGSALAAADLGYDILDELLDQASLPPQQRADAADGVGALREALDRATALHHQLRTSVSRLERCPESIRLDRLIAAVLRSLPSRLAARCDLEGLVAQAGSQGGTHDEAGPLHVWADRLHLARILHHVVYTCHEAMRVAGRTEGRVRLRCWRGDDGQAHITVLDDGPGLPDSLRERLADDGLPPPSDDLALGLVISRELALGEGGSLTLAAPRAGEGARFLLTVPGQEAHPTGAP